MLKVVWLNLLPSKVFAMARPPKVLALFRTSPVSISQTGAPLAISTSTRKPPQLHTPFPPNCTNLFTFSASKNPGAITSLFTSVTTAALGTAYSVNPTNNIDNQPLPAINSLNLLLRSSSRSRRILRTWRPERDNSFINVKLYRSPNNIKLCFY